MALYGLLGDIHANREALQAVLRALDAAGVRRLLCVGDLIGYNADPAACVRLLEARGAESILGNHDLIGTGRLGFERCSNKAMHALRRTRRILDDDTAGRIAALPTHRVIEGRVLLTHGGVRDVQQYMTRASHVLENARYLREDFPGIHVCFYGHTHEQRIFAVQGDTVSEPFADAIAEGRPITLPSGSDYFINPGSVDASRKRARKQAEYAIFDSGSMTLSFSRVPYADDVSEARASAAGLRIDRWRDRLYDVQRRFIGPRQMEQESS